MNPQDSGVKGYLFRYSKHYLAGSLYKKYKRAIKKHLHDGIGVLYL